MNEERTGKCLRQVEHIRGHLWPIYSITVNQVMVATVNFRNDDFNLTKTIFNFYMYVLKIVVCHFVLFLLPLSCLFFFDIRILITPLVSANSSYSMETLLTEKS
jgi:hypothetical protein